MNPAADHHNAASIASAARALCPLCGASGIEATAGVSDPDGRFADTWSFRRCGNTECGVYWLDPAPLPQEMWKAYTAYHTHTKTRGNFPGKPLLSLAHRFVQLAWLPLRASSGLLREARELRFMALRDIAPGHLLDIGCGGGRLLRRMQRLGWQVEGNDFDSKAAEKVMQRYNIPVHAGDLAQCALPAASLDAITMSQTIEHLYQPLPMLKECLRLLKRGGVLVMTTPNPQGLCAARFGPHWRGWEAPRHLQLFPVGTLRRLTEQSGFEIMVARTYSSDAAGIYRVSNRLAGNEPRSWAAELQALIWSQREEWREFQAQTSRPDSGQNVLLVARKP